MTPGPTQKKGTVMDVSSLPPELAARVEAAAKGRPRVAEVLERQVARHRAAQTDEARARVESDLSMLVEVGGRAPTKMWLLFVVVGLMGAATLGIYFWQESRGDRLPGGAVAATARVEELDEGFCLVGSKGSRCLEVKVTVFPPDRGPYTARTTQNLALMWLPRVQPGQWVTVKVSRDQPSEFVIDVDALKRPPPEPPAAAKP